MRQRFWRFVGVVVATVTVASVAAFVLFDTGPLHAAACYVGGRGGWYVEYPHDAVTADEIREVVPSCVSVRVGYVGWNEVADGELAIVPRGRDGFSHDDSIVVWVEGSVDEATDPCRPLGPHAMPPADCPGGPQRVPDS